MTTEPSRFPIYEWDVDVLKGRMHALGFDVQSIGKPVTFKDLDSIDYLSPESRNEIEQYAKAKEADGALVAGKQTWETHRDSSGERGHITIALYVLRPAGGSSPDEE